MKKRSLLILVLAVLMMIPQFTLYTDAYAALQLADRNDTVRLNAAASTQSKVNVIEPAFVDLSLEGIEEVPEKNVLILRDPDYADGAAEYYPGHKTEDLTVECKLGKYYSASSGKLVLDNDEVIDVTVSADWDCVAAYDILFFYDDSLLKIEDVDLESDEDGIVLTLRVRSKTEKAVSATNLFICTYSDHADAEETVEAYQIRFSFAAKPAQTTVAAATPRVSTHVTYVYVSKNATKNSKYHLVSTCSGMKNPNRMTLEEAKRAGYDACKKCAGG